MKGKIGYLFLVSLITSACSVRHTAYTTGGAAAGAGIGYSYHHDDTEAAIGAAAGGAVGLILAEIETKNQTKHSEKAYQEGYTQAKVDVAKKYWDHTTGRGAAQSLRPVKLKRFKVPEYQQDGVVYESHDIVLEDYR